MQSVNNHAMQSINNNNTVQLTTATHCSQLTITHFVCYTYYILYAPNEVR